MNKINYINQVFRATVRGFFADQCFLHASSLTFYNLLSIVPIIAVSLGIAKGFGFDQPLETALTERFQEHQVLLNHVFNFAKSLLVQAEGSKIAGIGAIFLFLFVLSLFWTIENSMNTIWKAKKFRSPLRMLTEYLAMMIIIPFLFVISTSMLVFVTHQLHGLLPETTSINLFYNFLTLGMIWAIFATVYLIMPNTYVRARFAISAAILTGSAYYFIQAIMINFQIGVSQYSAVYGSFAALPLFLLWLQISWLLLLIGAEIAYHAQHLAPTLSATESQQEVSRATFSLILVKEMAEAFEQGLPPVGINHFSNKWGVPTSIIDEIMGDLKSAKIINQVKSAKHDTFYQPALNTELITIQQVLDAIDHNIMSNISVNYDEKISTINQQFEEFKQECSLLTSNNHFKDV